MDINPLVQAAVNLLAAIALPVALAILQYGYVQAQRRWKFTVSQAAQASIEADIGSAVTMGIGWGRAKLASGQMQLAHVSTGNPHIDQIANGAFQMLSAQAQDSGITIDDLARRIVAGLGHALGNDPYVPSIGAAVTPAASAPAAAAA